MKINLWYSKGMQQWRWTLCEELRNGTTRTGDCHSGQRPFLRDAMEDVAKTVEYMLELKSMKGDQRSGSAAALHAVGHWFESDIAHLIFYTMQTVPDFYHIPTAIDRETAELIHKQMKDKQLETSLFHTGIEDKKIRNSQHHWISTDSWIAGMLKHFIEVANNNLFHYDLTKWSEQIQYTVYDGPSSHYTWHRDIKESSFGRDTVAKLSITLFLSDPEDYEGGEFQLMFHGDTYMHTMKPPIGTAIIFPATSRHRLRPLRSGKRTSLVAWMGGPPFR